MAPKKFVGLDVGERRIGVAIGDSKLRMAWAHGVVEVNGQETERINEILQNEDITDIVIGRPRNQSGEPTEQTKSVEAFVKKVLGNSKLPIHWQDESVTSVMAEERLQASGKPYSKADIDAQAAAIILQDFLEAL
jgi:putative holliday junction resolvase